MARYHSLHVTASTQHASLLLSRKVTSLGKYDKTNSLHFILSSLLFADLCCLCASVDSVALMQPIKGEIKRESNNESNRESPAYLRDTAKWDSFYQKTKQSSPALHELEIIQYVVQRCSVRLFACLQGSFCLLFDYLFFVDLDFGVCLCFLFTRVFSVSSGNSWIH